MQAGQESCKDFHIFYSLLALTQIHSAEANLMISSLLNAEQTQLSYTELYKVQPFQCHMILIKQNSAFS